MRNPEDAPLNETQTESQVSTEGMENIDILDLCDISSLAPQDNTPSSVSFDEYQRKELFAAAIEFLTDTSTEEAKNHNTHHFIEEAVNLVITFMDELLSPSTSPLEYMECIADLLHPLFVTRLFQLRVVFRGIAAQERPPMGANVTIISWVDDLLVKLCACILHLATNGATQDFNKRAWTQSIKSMQDNEARKAATQLPIRFTELPDALISKYSSPAMARMALTLLYGTTALRQRYSPDVEYEEKQLNIKGVILAVSTCIVKRGASLGSPSPLHPSTLVEYAILTSVYTYGVCVDTNDNFVPHTEHNVVGLVDLILDNISDTFCPPTNASLGALSILIEDLLLVTWFWNRWGDGSTSLAATGLRLTRHWIQHYGLGSTIRNQDCIDVLLSYAPCSFQAVLHLVEPLEVGVSAAPSLPSSEMLIVELVCEAYTALATTRQPGDLRYKEILAEACKRLCPYILASGAGEKLELTHKPLLRFLTSVGPTIVEISYEDTKEPQSRPNHRVLVEKVIQEIMVIVEGAEEGLKDQTELRGHFGSTKLKYMLDFLAILLHSSASAANGVVSSPVLIPKLISWMLKPPDKRPTLEHLQWSMLRTSSLLLLGFAYGHFKKRNSPTTDRFPDHEQDTFLEVVLDDKGDWLLETCALARYMIATEDIRILDDPVAMLGVWSQIRDTLLATLQRRFVAEQEPIAVAISGTLCASLVSILHTVGKQTRRMILASPWTQTLRVALEEVQTQNGGLDDFGLGLRRQLERPAEVLLRKPALNNKANGTNSTTIGSLKTGSPPASGLGLSTRVYWLHTHVDLARDIINSGLTVVPFPTPRPPLPSPPTSPYPISLLTTSPCSTYPSLIGRFKALHTFIHFLIPDLYLSPRPCLEVILSPLTIVSPYSTMAAPVPAPSFVITRTEEWPEADFDLTDDQESFSIDNEGETETDAGDLSSRLKGSRPSLSGAGAVAKLGGAPVEDEDWDAEFEDPPPKSSISATSSMSASLAKFAGKVTRLGSVQPEVSRPVEDWSDDGDLELPEPSQTNLTLARVPLPQADVPELEDTGDVSTIKVAKLNFPTVAALSKSAQGSKSSSTPNEDDDFEADFALPEDMANLSLKILAPQTSTLSLRHKLSTGVTEGNAPWGDMTTSSSAYSDTSSLMSMYPPDASPSVSSSSQPGTETDPSEGDFGIYEDDEDEAFDGLVLPEGLAGKALAKHLEIKKKVVPAKIAAEQSAKGANISRSHKAPNEAEDFESGLLIGDDEDFSPSRLRTRREAIDTPRSKSVPVPRSASIVKPHLRTESVIEVLASASNPSITRSRSPNSSSRGSLSRKDSRSSLVSPTFSSLRPSALRASSSTLPHSSTLSLLTIPGTPIVPSSISPRPVPLKHQKSVGRLQLSSPAGSGLGAQRLPRKASLSSLADASATVATSSGTPSTSSTVSARSSGFSAPTAASKARHKPEGREQAEAERKRSYPVPPTRPTTPSSNPVALRLTMPTSSSRQKIRPAISSVFPSPATATSQSFADRATSPQSNNPRRTPTSPRRVRTRSGASTGATPSSSISSITSAATSVKVLRKPKRGKTYGDGTELDAFDDLPEDREKERLYRVQPVGRGGVSRGEKGSVTAATPAVASGGTIGRRSAAATGTLRRPPSSASSHGSMDPPKNPGMQSLRHKPRVDFPPKVPVSVPVPEPAPRRRKPVVTPLNGPRKKPMLIRNLGGVGAAKTVGDMKWNPKTLRWEGNEQVLKEFDSHLPSSRPALITHFTGSTLGGIASPTGSFLASGARIVGNMMFDPVRMCWISRLPPEEDEPDVFAGLADEGDEWEDKAGTIRANVGLAGSTDDVQDWKGSVRSTNSDRAMTMSPTRSYTKSMSESGSEAGDPPPRGFDSRRSVRGSFGGLSVYEEVPGVDDSLVAACRAAEERHRQEMKGWNVRSRARSRSIKSSTETEEELGRTHLFDIRALATRKY